MGGVGDHARLRYDHLPLTLAVVTGSRAQVKGDAHCANHWAPPSSPLPHLRLLNADVRFTGWRIKPRYILHARKHHSCVRLVKATEFL